MGGQWSTCCCAERGCTLRILRANKTRHGFPPLYITSVVTGSTKKSKLRFLEKTIEHHKKHAESIGTGYVWDDEEIYTATVTINRLTGRAEYAETFLPHDFGFPNLFRADVASDINTWFATYKGTSGSSDTGATTTQGANRTIETWTSTMSGVDCIAFEYHREFYSDWHAAPIWSEFWRDIWIYDVKVELANEYEDDVYKADIDDLLTGHDTGSGVGLDGAPDNAHTLVAWNENGVNAALGSASATNGACWIDVTTLSSYTTPTDPAISLTTMDAATYYAFAANWWQGTADPADFFCSFEDEASLPPQGTTTNDTWTFASLLAVRFFVPADVCTTFARVDGASTTSEVCQLDAVAGDHVDVYEPHAVALSNSNIERSTGNHGAGVLFTSPGALTAGVCPCTAAP
jgi:hypothetical protein